MKLFNKMRQQKLLSAALMLVTLSVGILIGTLINTQVNAAKDQNVAPDATPLTIPKTSLIGNEFSALAKKLEPSVVNISVEINEPAQPRVQGRIPQPPSGGDDPLGGLRKFFGDDGDQGDSQEPEKHQASGTGFIVDRNGYIVTNNHVVENAVKIRVKLYGDATEYRGLVVGTDYETDLAVVKINTNKPLPTVMMGNSESVQVGDWAVAIGSPFGLEATVTAGIVSATGRDPGQLNARAFQHFIQTDAAINPGNSGGPLLNIKGEVIGVNTMIATSRGGSEGVGFALPSNMIVRVYNDIIKQGRVARGSIGVSLMSLEKPEVTMKALGVDHGVIVQTLEANAPADKSGLKKGDIITAIDGKPIKTNDDLIERISDTPVGSQVTLNVDRDGKIMDLKVTTRDRTDVYSTREDIAGPKIAEAVQFAKNSVKDGTAAVQFGFKPRPLNDLEKGQADNHRGVMVSRVEPDSFAEEIGIEEKDIIDSINRQPVNSQEDIVKIQAKLKPGDPVTFMVVRKVVVRQTKSGPSRENRVQYFSGNLPR